MQSFDYLIVGGGLAAASAVDGIRSLDAEGSIAILANESEPPYHRPPLSKEFLQTPEATRDLLHVKPEGWFEEEAKVTLLNGVRATSLDPKKMTIGTAADEIYQGERILLAMGGRPRSLAIPGTELDGVSSFRTVADAERLRERAVEAESALLIGAGFIGMELAASLTRYDVASTIVERKSRVWSEMLPPVLSYFVQGYFEERGIRFELDAEVEELLGSERLEGARLANGTQVACDLTVIGVGLRPNEEIAGEAGLAVMDGVIVDRSARPATGTSTRRVIWRAFRTRSSATRRASSIGITPGPTARWPDGTWPERASPSTTSRTSTRMCSTSASVCSAGRRAPTTSECWES